MASDGEENYVAAVDIGTTTLRCFILNTKANIVGRASTQIILHYPKPQHVEINPDELWNSVINTIKEAIFNAHLSAGHIKSLGVSTQRSTFITWDKTTGSPFHNFITWKDMRAKDLIKQWNSSLTVKSLRFGAYCIHFCTGSKRFLTGSRFKFASSHSTVKLAWALSNIPDLKEAVEKDNALFGTIDTWLVYKFTAGKHHVTDITNASATGLYDPYVKQWGIWAVNVLKIPTSILPQIVANDFEFGKTAQSIFGAEIPITCMIADQSASLVGSCCFKSNDLKVTLGTGSFLNINTGEQVHSGSATAYPLVAWKLKKETLFALESACNDTGSLIEWALNSGLCRSASETSSLATSVASNDGVYFVPAFSGLGPPINDEKAASGFIGIKPTTRKEHMIRSILESIVFRVVHAFEALKKQMRCDYKKICVDGGVSKNNFICQLLADLTGLDVERAETTELSILGVAFLTGMASGVWKSRKDLKKLRKVERCFYPTTNKELIEKQKAELYMWAKAANRFKSWSTME